MEHKEHLPEDPNAQESLVDVGRVSREQLMIVYPSLHYIFHQFDGLQETFNFTELFTLLQRGDVYECWIGYDKGNIEAFLITAIIRYEKKAVMHIVGVVGENLISKYIPRGFQKIEQYAALMGVTEIVLDGRKGWDRVLRKYGYGVTLQMRKNIKIMWSN